MVPLGQQEREQKWAFSPRKGVQGLVSRRMKWPGQTCSSESSFWPQLVTQEGSTGWGRGDLGTCWFEEEEPRVWLQRVGGVFKDCI